MVDIPSQITDPVGVVDKVNDKMQALLSVAKKFVASRTPTQIEQDVEDWDTLVKLQLHVSEKEFPVFRRLVLEEAKRAKSAMNTEDIPLAADSDAESEPEPPVEESLFPDDLEMNQPSTSKVNTPKLSTDKVTTTPKRLKTLKSESPPKKSRVQFGTAPISLKRNKRAPSLHELEGMLNISLKSFCQKRLLETFYFSWSI